MEQRFFFLSHHMPRDGYGYGGLRIIDALWELGALVEPVDMLDEDHTYTQFGSSTWTVRGPALALCVPEWWGDIVAERLVGSTMFEATRMPAGRVEAINGTADVCLVPCEWCREMFVEQGVRVPVRVVRWGIDPGDYYPLERDQTLRQAQGKPYTFLWSGTPDKRKGWDLVYRAFWKAFGHNKDAKLVLRFRKLPRCLSGCNDENVEIVEGLLNRPGMRRLLQEADCFVFPSRGEGWGLPPREAAATGLPAIVTNWSGLTEELEHWGLPVDVAGLEPAEFGGWEKGQVGEWAVPDLDHLVWQMRWCFENREFAAQAGENAAAWLAEHATWERTARGVLEVMQGC